MHSKYKRLLSLALALIMMLSMLPTGLVAIAEEGEDTVPPVEEPTTSPAEETPTTTPEEETPTTTPEEEITPPSADETAPPDGATNQTDGANQTDGTTTQTDGTTQNETTAPPEGETVEEGSTDTARLRFEISGLDSGYGLSFNIMDIFAEHADGDDDSFYLLEENVPFERKGGIYSAEYDVPADLLDPDGSYLLLVFDENGNVGTWYDISPNKDSLFWSYDAEANEGNGRIDGLVQNLADFDAKGDGSEYYFLMSFTKKQVPQTIEMQFTTDDEDLDLTDIEVSVALVEGRGEMNLLDSHHESPDEDGSLTYETDPLRETDTVLLTITLPDGYAPVDTDEIKWIKLDSSAGGSVPSNIAVSAAIAAYNVLAIPSVFSASAAVGGTAPDGGMVTYVALFESPENMPSVLNTEITGLAGAGIDGASVNFKFSFTSSYSQKSHETDPAPVYVKIKDPDGSVIYGDDSGDSTDGKLIMNGEIPPVEMPYVDGTYYLEITAVDEYHLLDNSSLKQFQSDGKYSELGWIEKVEKVTNSEGKEVYKYTFAIYPEGYTASDDVAATISFAALPFGEVTIRKTVDEKYVKYLEDGKSIWIGFEHIGTAGETDNCCDDCNGSPIHWFEITNIDEFNTVYDKFLGEVLVNTLAHAGADKPSTISTIVIATRLTIYEYVPSDIGPINGYKNGWTKMRVESFNQSWLPPSGILSGYDLYKYTKGLEWKEEGFVVELNNGEPPVDYGNLLSSDSNLMADVTPTLKEAFFAKWTPKKEAYYIDSETGEKKSLSEISLNERGDSYSISYTVRLTNEVDSTNKELKLIFPASETTFIYDSRLASRDYENHITGYYALERLGTEGFYEIETFDVYDLLSNGTQLTGEYGDSGATLHSLTIPGGSMIAPDFTKETDAGNIYRISFKGTMSYYNGEYYEKVDIVRSSGDLDTKDILKDKVVETTTQDQLLEYFEDTIDTDGNAFITGMRGVSIGTDTTDTVVDLGSNPSFGLYRRTLDPENGLNGNHSRLTFRLTRTGNDPVLVLGTQFKDWIEVSYTVDFKDNTEDAAACQDGYDVKNSATAYLKDTKANIPHVKTKVDITVPTYAYVTIDKYAKAEGFDAVPESGVEFKLYGKDDNGDYTVLIGTATTVNGKATFVDSEGNPAQIWDTDYDFENDTFKIVYIGKDGTTPSDDPPYQYDAETEKKGDVWPNEGGEYYLIVKLQKNVIDPSDDVNYKYNGKLCGETHIDVLNVPSSKVIFEKKGVGISESKFYIYKVDGATNTHVATIDPNGNASARTLTGLAYGEYVLYEVTSNKYQMQDGEDVLGPLTTGIPEDVTYNNTTQVVYSKTFTVSPLGAELQQTVTVTNEGRNDLIIKKSLPNPHATASKTFTFNVYKLDDNGVREQNPVNFKQVGTSNTYNYAASDEGGASASLVLNYVATTGDTITLKNLPKGKYEVVEIGGTTLDGVPIYTVTYDNNTAEVDWSSEPQPITVTVTNASIDPGSLTVEKIVTGEDDGSPFTFTIKQGNTPVALNAGAGGNISFNGTGTGSVIDGANGQFTLTGGATATITGLSLGVTYTVTENDHEYYTLVGDNDVEEKIIAAGNSVTFTNTRDTGELTVKKTVQYERTDKVFEFSIKTKAGIDVYVTSENDGAYKYVPAGTDGAKSTLSFSADASAVITGLPYGEYVLTETAAGYEITYTVENGEFKLKTPSMDVGVNNKNNTTLIIHKDLRGSNEERSFNVQLFKADTTQPLAIGKEGADSKYFINYNNTNPNVNDTLIAIKEGESATVYGVEPGVSYYVKEVPESTFPYDISYSIVFDQNETKPSRSGDIEIKTDNPNEVTVFNDADTAKLFIEKIVSPTDDEGTFKIVVSGSFGAEYKYEEKDYYFSYNAAPDGTGAELDPAPFGKPIEVEGVYPGNNYTITEYDAQGEHIQYYEVIIALEEIEDSAHGDSPVIVNNNSLTILPGETITITVENTRKTADLTVTKQITGGEDNWRVDEGFSFTVEGPGLSDTTDIQVNGVSITDAQKTAIGLKITGDTVTFTLTKDIRSVTFKGLRAGAEYTVTEDDPSTDSVYYLVGSTVADYDEKEELKKGTTQGNTVFERKFNLGGFGTVVTYENSANELVVTKDVVGGGSDTLEFGFTVLNNNGDIPLNFEEISAPEGSKETWYKYVAVATEDSISEIPIKDDQTARLFGIPIGTLVTVEETTKIGYAATYDPHGSNGKDTTPPFFNIAKSNEEVTITNTNQAYLTIEKKLAHSSETGKTFEMQLYEYDPDTKDEKRVYVVADGKNYKLSETPYTPNNVEIEVKQDLTVTVSGVEPGKAYIIKEVGDGDSNFPYTVKYSSHKTGQRYVEIPIEENSNYASIYLIATNTPKDPTLTVKKTVDPVADTGVFKIVVEGTFWQYPTDKTKNDKITTPQIFYFSQTAGTIKVGGENVTSYAFGTAATVVGVIAGESYTVTEYGENGTVLAAYTTTATDIDGTATQDGGWGGKTAKLEANSTTNVVLTNKREVDGKLEVTKKVNGTFGKDTEFTFVIKDAANNPLPNYEYIIKEVEYDENNPKPATDADGKFTLKANETAVFSGLTINAKYTVAELVDDDLVTVGDEKYKLVSAESVEATIPPRTTGAATVTFTNERLNDGEIRLTKKANSLANIPDGGFTFALYENVDGAWVVSKDGGTLYFTKEVVEAESPQNTLKWSNLINGKTYRVVETSGNGYVLTGWSEDENPTKWEYDKNAGYYYHELTIPKNDGKSNADFALRGENLLTILEVTKEVIGAVGLGDNNKFKFTVSTPGNEGTPQYFKRLSHDDEENITYYEYTTLTSGDNIGNEITIGANEKAIFYGLPKGTYIIDETVKNGYDLTTTSQNLTVIIKDDVDDDNPSKVTLTNENLTKLTINKVLVNSQENKSFEVELYSATGFNSETGAAIGEARVYVTTPKANEYTVSATPTDIKIMVPANKSVAVTNLTPGLYYYVKETGAGDNGFGYNVTYYNSVNAAEQSAENNHLSNIQIENGGDANKSLTVKNTPNDNPALLSVTKNADDAGSDEFTITVNGLFWTPGSDEMPTEKTDKTFTFTNNAEKIAAKTAYAFGTPVPVTGIVAGTDYTISEDAVNPAKLTDYTASWKVDNVTRGVEGATSITVEGSELKGGAAVVVAATNDRGRNAEIKVAKTVTGTGTWDASDEFTFTLEGAGAAYASFDPAVETEVDGNKVTFYLTKTNQSVVISGLLDGEIYTVTEISVDGSKYTFTAWAAAPEGSWTEVTENEVAISGAAQVQADSTGKKVTFTNTRMNDGAIALTKIVEGSDYDPATDEFKFVITKHDGNGTYICPELTKTNLADGTPAAVTLETTGEAAERVTTLTIPASVFAGGESYEVTITGLERGQTYKFTELADAKYSVTPDTLIATGIATVADAEITFTNTRETAEVSLTKDINDDGVWIDGKIFTFELYRKAIVEGAEIWTSEGTQTVNSTNRTANWSGIAVGDELIIVELNPGNYIPAGWTAVDQTFIETNSIGSIGDYYRTVSADDELTYETVEVTNNLTKLIVTKDVALGEVKEGFEFQVFADGNETALSFTGANGVYHYVPSPSAGDGSTKDLPINDDGTVTIYGLPYDGTYTVEESIKNAYTATYDDNQTFTFTKDKLTNNTKITNTNEALLEVVKELDKSEDYETEFEFQLYESRDDGVTWDDVGVVTDKDLDANGNKTGAVNRTAAGTFKLIGNQKITISNVEPGYSYFVVEVEPTIDDGYDYEAATYNDETIAEAKAAGKKSAGIVEIGSGDLDANIPESDPATIKLITATNTPKEGERLYVNKIASTDAGTDLFIIGVKAVVADGENGFTDSDAEEKFYYFSSNPGNWVILVSDTVYPLNANKGDGVAVTGVIPGITYIITEYEVDQATGTSTGNIISTYEASHRKTINNRQEPGWTDGGTTEQKIKATEKVLVTFSNTRSTEGEFYVTKRVVGPYDSGDKFTFQIDSTDANETLTYKISPTGEEKTVKSGGTITLKDGETAHFYKLPVGSVYTVTELAYTNNKYVLVSSQLTGAAAIDDRDIVPIAAKLAPDVDTVTYTNTRATTGELTVTKALTDGTPWDNGAAFNFVLTGDLPATGVMINGQPATMELDGSYKFTLTSATRTAIITGLYAEAEYTVQETGQATNYLFHSVQLNTEEPIKADDAKIDAKDGDEVTFVNTMADEGTITLKKVVQGLPGETDKTFYFRLYRQYDDEWRAYTTATSDPNNGENVTVNGANINITISGNGTYTATLTGLEPGTYTIIEFESIGAREDTNLTLTTEVITSLRAKSPDGFEVEYGENAIGTTLNFTEKVDNEIKDGEIWTATEEITNTAKKTSIKVTKTIDVPNHDDDVYTFYYAMFQNKNNLSEADFRLYTRGELTIAGEAIPAFEGFFTVDSKNKTFPLEYIDADCDYAIYEFKDKAAWEAFNADGETKLPERTNEGARGFEVIYADNLTTDNNVYYSVNPKGGETAEIGLTNTPLEAELQFTKTVDGLHEDDETEYTFNFGLYRVETIAVPTEENPDATEPGLVLYTNAKMDDEALPDGKFSLTFTGNSNKTVKFADLIPGTYYVLEFDGEVPNDPIPLKNLGQYTAEDVIKGFTAEYTEGKEGAEVYYGETDDKIAITNTANEITIDFTKIATFIEGDDNKYTFNFQLYKAETRENDEEPGAAPTKIWVPYAAAVNSDAEEDAIAVEDGKFQFTLSSAEDDDSESITLKGLVPGEYVIIELKGDVEAEIADADMSERLADENTIINGFTVSYDIIPDANTPIVNLSLEYPEGEQTIANHSLSIELTVTKNVTGMVDKDAEKTFYFGLFIYNAAEEVYKLYSSEDSLFTLTASANIDEDNAINSKLFKDLIPGEYKVYEFANEDAYNTYKKAYEEENENAMPIVRVDEEEAADGFDPVVYTFKVDEAESKTESVELTPGTIGAITATNNANEITIDFDKTVTGLSSKDTTVRKFYFRLFIDNSTGNEGESWEPYTDAAIKDGTGKGENYTYEQLTDEVEPVENEEEPGEIEEADPMLDGSVFKLTVAGNIKDARLTLTNLIEGKYGIVEFDPEDENAPPADLIQPDTITIDAVEFTVTNGESGQTSSLTLVNSTGSLQKTNTAKEIELEVEKTVEGMTEGSGPYTFAFAIYKKTGAETPDPKWEIYTEDYTVSPDTIVTEHKGEEDPDDFTIFGLTFDKDGTQKATITDLLPGEYLVLELDRDDEGNLLVPIELDEQQLAQYMEQTIGVFTVTYGKAAIEIDQPEENEEGEELEEANEEVIEEPEDGYSADLNYGDTATLTILNTGTNTLKVTKNITGSPRVTTARDFTLKLEVYNEETKKWDGYKASGVKKDGESYLKTDENGWFTLSASSSADDYVVFEKLPVGRYRVTEYNSETGSANSAPSGYRAPTYSSTDQTSGREVTLDLGEDKEITVTNRRTGTNSRTTPPGTTPPGTTPPGTTPPVTTTAPPSESVPVGQTTPPLISPPGTTPPVTTPPATTAPPSSSPSTTPKETIPVVTDDPPKASPTPTPTVTPTSRPTTTSKPTTTITDNSTPLSTPKTADEIALTALWIMAAVSAAGIAVGVLLRRRKKEDD